MLLQRGGMCSVCLKHKIKGLSLVKPAEKDPAKIKIALSEPKILFASALFLLRPL